MTLLVKTGKKTEHLSQVGGVQTGGGRGRQEGDATTASFTETTPPNRDLPSCKGRGEKGGLSRAAADKQRAEPIGPLPG